MTNAWDPPLPATETWGPTNSTEKIGALFHRRCRAVEQRILLRAKFERETNEQNFDSGPAVEEIVREELGQILPRRYGVHAGSLSNRNGWSAGDCDVVIFNDHWFPSIKPPATAESRRVHYPIEGTFGVMEVKQSLTPATLDQAMSKLVAVSRLEVERAPERVVENRVDAALEQSDAQPVFTGIIAAGLGPGFDFDDIVHRFIAINGLLQRRELINVLCVLGVGFVTWVYDVDGAPVTTYFRDTESGFHLSPMLVRVRDPQEESALYELVTVLLGYLGEQVLVVDDVAVNYGAPQKGSRPIGSSWDMHPDGCDCFDSESSPNI